LVFSGLILIIMFALFQRVINGLDIGSVL
jgi:hypothetical protein